MNLTDARMDMLRLDSARAQAELSASVRALTRATGRLIRVNRDARASQRAEKRERAGLMRTHRHG